MIVFAPATSIARPPTRPISPTGAAERLPHAQVSC